MGAIALAASPAAAQVTESSTITSSYTYRVGSQQGSQTDPGGTTRLFFRDEGGGFESEGGLGLEAMLDNGSFTFLHSGFCVGDCEITISTDIVFTLTNMGPDPANLRFDSQITPGHLARSSFFGPSDGGGSFRFQVQQDPGTLYTNRFGARGNAAANPISLTTSDGNLFNGYTAMDNDPDFNVVDWSATNLSVNLATINPGASSTFIYHSEMLVQTFTTDCMDVRLCEGFQVAFGDPRAQGGATRQALSAFSSFATLADPIGSALADPVFPAVGAVYDPFTVNYAFVPVTDPLPQPPQPPVIERPDYTVGYRPFAETGAVPEPATWAMMLLGFGAIGASARRRKRVLTQAI